MCISNRGRSGTKAVFPRAMGVRIEKGALPCMDHNKLGLRGTVGGFSIALSDGIYVSMNTSAKKFASYVLRGKTMGICSVSMKCKRLS